MIKNKKRIGNFTSSEIIALTKNGRGKNEFGKSFFTYIENKNKERRLNRSINTEISARPLSWGLLNESIVFSMLGLDYKPCSSETITHPEFDFWAGSPDLEKFEGNKLIIPDIKCPITLNSFCDFVDNFDAGIETVRKNHKDGEKYYWQIVSNCILKGSNTGELIIYLPYKDELDYIREVANNYDGSNVHQFFWLTVASDLELPFIERDGYYKNLNFLQFEIPDADIEFLTKRVTEASKLLIDRK
jgi:hypothetical protein